MMRCRLSLSFLLLLLSHPTSPLALPRAAVTGLAPFSGSRGDSPTVRASTTLPTTIDERRRAAASTSPTSFRPRDPLFSSLSALVGQVRSALASEVRPYPGEHRALIEEVRHLLERTRLNPREWEPHAVLRRERYTRTVVAVDPEFVAPLLCWGPGQVADRSSHACGRRATFSVGSR